MPRKKLIYATPSCESLLGYTATELKEIDLEALFHPDDHSYIYDNCSLYSTHSDEDSRTITYRILSKSGDYIWLETLSKKKSMMTKEIYFIYKRHQGM